MAIATTLSDIQTLMKYFSSILGFALMYIIPCSLIYAYRKKFSISNIESGKLNRAILKSGLSLIIYSLIGLTTIGLIIYGFFKKKSDYHCVENYINNEF